MQWHTPVIPALGRLSQENLKYKVSLASYIAKNDSNKQITHRAGNAAYHRAEVVRFENDLARPGLSLRSLPRP